MAGPGSSGVLRACQRLLDLYNGVKSGVAWFVTSEMPEARMTVDELKRQVGDRAADMVTSGNVVGLGSGSYRPLCHLAHCRKTPYGLLA